MFDMWSIINLLFFLEVLIHVNSQTCRVCDQFISGRNLPYERALSIIQDEEYLDDSDFDEIRYKRRYDSQSYNEGKMIDFFSTSEGLPLGPLGSYVILAANNLYHFFYCSLFEFFYRTAFEAEKGRRKTFRYWIHK